METRCKNCKHWDRRTYPNWPEPDKVLKIGTCLMIEGDVSYWENEDVVEKKIKDGRLDGENVYTSENFGCIHFATS